jgi:hypothetical protein
MYVGIGSGRIGSGGSTFKLLLFSFDGRRRALPPPELFMHVCMYVCMYVYMFAYSSKTTPNWDSKMCVFIHYMYKLNASLGKSVISGMNGGKKACAAVVSHIVCFKFINIKSRKNICLAWHVLFISHSCKIEFISLVWDKHAMLKRTNDKSLANSTITYYMYIKTIMLTIVSS